MTDSYLLKNYFPALALLLLSAAVSGGLLIYSRDGKLDAALFASLVYAVAYAVFSLICTGFLALIWLSAFSNVDRALFRSIWMACLFVVGTIFAVLCSYWSWEYGRLGLNTPNIYLYAAPYYLALQALVMLTDDETEDERQQRKARLPSLQIELRAEAARSRVRSIPLLLIACFTGGWAFWTYLPVEPGLEWIAAGLGAAMGIPLGMAVHRYLPAQKRLRELERAIEHART